MCSPPSCVITQRPMLLHGLFLFLFLTHSPQIMTVVSGCGRKVCFLTFPFFSHTGYRLHQIRFQDIHQEFSSQMTMPDFSLCFSQFLKFLFPEPYALLSKNKVLLRETLLYFPLPFHNKALSLVKICILLISRGSFLPCGSVWLNLQRIVRAIQSLCLS